MNDERIVKIGSYPEILRKSGKSDKGNPGYQFYRGGGRVCRNYGRQRFGKTTLLNCISTVDTVSAGHIYLDKTDVTELKEKEIARFRRENLGFIFQDFNLLDTLTIGENIALALTINRIPALKVDGKVQQIAEALNIQDILTKYPYEVSGGQQEGAVPVPEPLSIIPSCFLPMSLRGALTVTPRRCFWQP